MGELLFQDKKNVILERWRDAILNTYPRDTVGFLRREQDRFANPVGHVLARETATLLDALLSGEPPSTTQVHTALDELVKIRAVQDFSAAEALEFILFLKQIIREVFHDEAPDPGDMLNFDTRVDRLVLAAFDCYTKNRERIFTIRVNEIKNRSIKLLERANLMFAESGAQTHSDDGGTDPRGPKGG